MKTISLIVPIYNVEQTIIGCLASIRAQSYTDFECLCIDDGSPDRSAELVADFIEGDDRFVLIRQENKGLGGARNTGMRHAVGDWITFVDSDDYLHPQALELLLQAGERYNADIVDSTSAHVRTPAPYTPIMQRLDQVDSELIDDPFTRLIRLSAIYTVVWGKLYRRDLIDSYPFTEGVYYEDTPWTVVILARCASYARLDQPLYYYYENNGSIMRTPWTTRKTEDYVRAIRDTYMNVQRLCPARLGELRNHLITCLILNLVNDIWKSPKSIRATLRAHARPLMRDLYRRAYIGFHGMRWKHKIRLWLLLH